MKYEQIEILKGDITKITADAIVNAANSTLMGGGGVDGAIHRAGGAEILEGCREIIAKQGKCATGEAVITTAGKLAANYVIHTVGPVWNGGNKDEAKKLANCYINSMKLAEEHDCSTIAFPNISTGVYGYPKKEAADVSIKAICNYIKEHESNIRILLVCFDDDNLHYVQEALNNQ